MMKARVHKVKKQIAKQKAEEESRERRKKVRGIKSYLLYHIFLTFSTQLNSLPNRLFWRLSARYPSLKDMDGMLIFFLLLLLVKKCKKKVFD